MATPRLSRLELQIMDVLWTRGPLSIRQVQEAFSERRRPAYSTIQTTIYRLEGKKAVHRVRKIGNAHIFESSIGRDAAHGRLIDEFVGLFGGRTQPVMTYLIGSGQLTLEDLREAERTLQRIAKRERKPWLHLKKRRGEQNVNRHSDRTPALRPFSGLPFPRALQSGCRPVCFKTRERRRPVHGARLRGGGCRTIPAGGIGAGIRCHRAGRVGAALPDELHHAHGGQFGEWTHGSGEL